MRLARLHLYLVLVFWSQLLLNAQPPVTYDPHEGMISLDVLVTDHTGKPVSGIVADDLRLLDNGKPAQILTFRAHDETSRASEPPVTTILLVDTLDMPERFATFERREVVRFLRQNSGHLAQPISLMEVSTAGVVSVGQPSTDGNALATDFLHNNHLQWISGQPANGLRGRSLERVVSGSAAGSALKALGDVAAAQRQLPGRKVLLWIGPGWGVGTGAQLKSGDSRQAVFDEVEWFYTLLREARISLYSFSVGETNADGLAMSYVSYLGGLKTVQQALPMYVYRKVLAVQTGGRVLASAGPLTGGVPGSLTDFRQEVDLVQQIKGCVAEAGTYYTLTFDPLPADYPDQYRSLRVQVSKPGLSARTTAGYYDQTYYSDQPDPAMKSVTVAELETLLANVRDRSDAQQSQAISELILTERLSRARLAALSAGLRGARARQALVALADASAFRVPPPDEIVADPPPDSQTQQRIVAQALLYLSKTMPNLPNFYASRTAIHYQENPGFSKGDARIAPQPLHVASIEKDRVFYRNGSEVGESASGKIEKPKEGRPYLTTYGTFGPILNWTFHDVFTTANGLAWERWEQFAGRTVAVFRYREPKGSSTYVGGCCLPDGDASSPFRSRVGYHGEVAIDPATGAVFRLEMIFDLLSTTPLDSSSIVIEYGPVEIAGVTYICPARSVAISRGRSVATMSETLYDLASGEWRQSFHTYGPYATMMNDITFNTFHLFHANARMLTDVASADSGEGPKESEETPEKAMPSEETVSPPDASTDEVALSANAALAALPLEAPPVEELLPAEENLPDKPFQFVINVNRTIVPVVVRDKQGLTVGDLKEEDFKVFDNGKPRAIERFSVEKHEQAESIPSSARQDGGPSAQAAALPQRITVYLFDDLHLSATELAYLKKMDAGALDGALTGADLAAVASTSGKVNSGLTQDRVKLHDAINSLQSRSLFTASAGECPKIDYYQADLIEDKHDSGARASALAQAFACNPALDPQRDRDQALSMVESAARRSLMAGEQDVRVTLATLKEYVRRMTRLPGRRTLVLVSPGFLSIAPGSLNVESQIVDLALDSNVTINALDARGLYSGATDISERGAGQIINPTSLAALSRAEGVMSELANGTGGTFFHNNNDLSAGFRSVSAAPEYVYLLDLSLDGVKPDGSFHRIEIRVDKPGAQIQSRRGYSAPQQIRQK